MIPRILTAICGLVLWSGAPAASATLRQATTLTTDEIRLADLFDNAGANADRVLGPAPVPGARIFVEARQLAAIARQFGVDWRPGSTADRITLDRPGRLMPPEDIIGVLRAALSGLGAPSDFQLDLPGFASPMVAVGAVPRASIDQLDYDAAGGRFTGALSITADGMAPISMRLAGTVAEMVALPVPLHRIAAGAVIQADDLQLVRLRAELGREETVHDVAQAVGMAVRRVALPGQPLRVADLVRPSAVLKGGRVTMQLQAPGLSLAAQGVALEADATGDRIRVLNPTSRAVVEVEIVGPEQVRVLPTSRPGPLGALALNNAGAAADLP
jgi:flagella basal body P-ring formation protein FlgA